MFQQLLGDDPKSDPDYVETATIRGQKCLLVQVSYQLQANGAGILLTLFAYITFRVKYDVSVYFRHLLPLQYHEV